MGGAHHCDGDPAPDVAAHLGGGLLPLGGEAYRHAFHCGILLDAYQDIH